MTTPAQMLLHILSNPTGHAKAIGRALKMASITKQHLSQVPEDADQTRLNILANRWAKTLLSAMDIELTITGQDVSGALLISNHRSYVDILLLLAGTPCCFLAKSDVANWPVIGTAASRVGTVFVERDAKDSRQASRQAIRRLLEAGHTIVVFPEGTTHPGPGCASFRRGAFEVAHEIGAPVLPVAIEYGRASDAWANEHVLMHFLRCFSQPKVRAKLFFGPEMRADSADALMNHAHQWINETLLDAWPDVEHTR